MCMADGTRRGATGSERAAGRNGRVTTQHDHADAPDEPTGDRDGSERLSASSPLTRRWCALARGWQALALGLTVVGLSAVVF